MRSHVTLNLSLKLSELVLVLFCFCRRFRHSVIHCNYLFLVPLDEYDEYEPPKKKQKFYILPTNPLSSSVTDLVHSQKVSINKKHPEKPGYCHWFAME